jgi:hypothetical protein
MGRARNHSHAVVNSSYSSRFSSVAGEIAGETVVSATSLSALSASESRRNSLLEWMRERSAHDGLNASQIVDVSGIYVGHGRYDRCFADLQTLAKAGAVERDRGRPATWHTR